MEALMDQFTFLSNQSLGDRSFDPSRIEDLMKLFELEAYKAWADMELEQETEVKEAENSLKETEEYLELTMESAMEEFHRFEEEMENMAKAEYDSLNHVAEKARSLGKTMEKAATFAAKKYIEAAMNSAKASMNSAVKAISANSKKVHPS
ncbi:hypothetical protein Leryth_011865 [Lithospermum erythrorhizon]|nr:hypothetical protein Leryth_011865 [Lithospermum erythrorhizon]